MLSNKLKLNGAIIFLLADVDACCLSGVPTNSLSLSVGEKLINLGEAITDVFFADKDESDFGGLFLGVECL